MEPIHLTTHYSFLQGGELTPFCLPYCFDGNSSPLIRPAVIVVPGGAYAMVSKREGFSVAASFLALGFQTFVLTYKTVSDGVHYPEESLELACAVDYLKKHASNYFVNPDEVFAIGFSAGGHLVGTLTQKAKDWKKEYSLNPILRGIGLIYPVITSQRTNAGTIDNLLQGIEESKKEELRKELSLENHVQKDNPPAFICLTATDQSVPCEHGISYALACAKVGVPVELHVYPKGPHGLSDGSKEINSMYPADCYDSRFKRWKEDCASFFRGFCKEEF